MYFVWSGGREIPSALVKAKKKLTIPFQMEGGEFRDAPPSSREEGPTLRLAKEKGGFFL